MQKTLLNKHILDIWTQAGQESAKTEHKEIERNWTGRKTEGKAKCEERYENKVTMTSALANSSAKFRFRGVSAHASSAPEKGRSSLDAVEAMNYMVNMMREHIPQQARIHYVITNGGRAPNVIPDFAEVYYYVRHPDKTIVKQLFERVVKAANGAAQGTETTMEYEIIGGTHDLLLNKSLAEVMQKNQAA